MDNRIIDFQSKIATIVDYVNSVGGAVQFHKLRELFISTIDPQGNKSGKITSCVFDLPHAGEEIKINRKLADKIIEAINKK